MVSLDCNICNHKNNCLYSKINSHITRARWNELKKTFIYKKNDYVFKEGETPQYFFCVCKGKIKIEKNTLNGNEAIISIRAPGMMFGYACLCKNKKYELSAISMGESFVSGFHKDLWIEILKSDFEFCIEIMRQFCIEIGNLQEKIASTLYQTAEEKISSVLLNHISFPTHTEQIPVVYNLKRNDIAKLCGLRIETVVRILKKLEKDKIIKRDKSYIRVLNIDKLKSNANNL